MGKKEYIDNYLNFIHKDLLIYWFTDKDLHKDLLHRFIPFACFMFIFAGLFSDEFRYKICTFTMHFACYPTAIIIIITICVYCGLYSLFTSCYTRMNLKQETTVSDLSGAEDVSPRCLYKLPNVVAFQEVVKHFQKFQCVK